MAKEKAKEKRIERSRASFSCQGPPDDYVFGHRLPSGYIVTLECVVLNVKIFKICKKRRLYKFVKQI